VDIGTRGDTRDRKQAAARYAALGYTPAAIRKHMPGLAIGTLSDWRHADWWQPLVDTYVVEATGSSLTTFAPRLPKALEAIDTIIDDHSARTSQLQAAIHVLDRIFGKPVIREQTDARIAISIQYEDVSGENLGIGPIIEAGE